MGKTLKYVKEFEFPSDKGYSASSGQTMVKGYARGGSCKMAKGGMAEGGKMDRLKSAIGNERKEIARVEDKRRDAGQEISRVRSEMRYDKNEMKGMRKQYPTDRREPMVGPMAAMAKGGMLYSKKEVNAKNLLREGKAPALPHAKRGVNMAKGGHVSKKIMKKFDGGYIQDPASSGVPQGVSPLTQIANPQAQPALQNMIPPGNTSLSPTAMKRGGKVGAKLVKMANGGGLPSVISKQLSLNSNQLRTQPQMQAAQRGIGSAPMGRPSGPVNTGGLGQGGLPSYMTTSQSDIMKGDKRPAGGFNLANMQQGLQQLAARNNPQQMPLPPRTQTPPPQPQFRNDGNPMRGNPMPQAEAERMRAQAIRQESPEMDRMSAQKFAQTQQLMREAQLKQAARQNVPSRAAPSAPIAIPRNVSPNISPQLMGRPGMAKGGLTSKQQKKVGKVMGEFKAGDLHSGKNGPVVKSRKQAIAIGLSEARKAKK